MGQFDITNVGLGATGERELQQMLTEEDFNRLQLTTLSPASRVQPGERPRSRQNRYQGASEHLGGWFAAGVDPHSGRTRGGSAGIRPGDRPYCTSILPWKSARP